jgi:hypothetical protein
MKNVLAMAVAAVALSGCGMYPPYQVWEQKLAGEAELAKADSTRRVTVLEAQAKKDSAVMLAQAEVERAKGVAAANAIIGKSLEGNESYLRYLWITEVAGKDVNKTVVYVPTNGNMPIMEAGRVTGVTK